MTGTLILTPEGRVERRCACGNELPPYSGRGRRPSKCDECKHERRQRSRRKNERRRYRHDPEFRARKLADSQKARAARKDARTSDA